MAKKLLQLPLLFIAACLLAGFYGAVHNQISYSVAPSYFHEFKFDQFRIEGFLRNRIGASLVGFHASWFMGLIIGIPIGLLTLIAPDPRSQRVIFFKTSILVVVMTFIIGLAALIHGVMSIHESHLPVWMQGRNISDPVAFARAGHMHNFSYLGGVIGLILGTIYAVRYLLKMRKS